LLVDNCLTTFQDSLSVSFFKGQVVQLVRLPTFRDNLPVPYSRARQSEGSGLLNPWRWGPDRSYWNVGIQLRTYAT